MPSAITRKGGRNPFCSVDLPKVGLLYGDVVRGLFIQGVNVAGFLGWLWRVVRGPPAVEGVEVAFRPAMVGV